MPKKKSIAKKQLSKFVSVPTLRQKMVGTILAYGGDEYETKEDVVDLAMCSEEQLADKLMDMLDYYYDAYNRSND